MNRNCHQHLLACALLVGMGLARAQAQPGPTADAAGVSSQHGRHDDSARHAERRDRHLAELKQKLQISASQEGAWTSFATAMQPPTAQPADRQAMAAMTTPERMDQMRAMRYRRNAEMDRRAEATKAFYSHLTPPQKQTFDAETARMAQNHRHGQHDGPGQGGSPSK
ncbi:MAG: hypothetical protein NVS2B4_10180 [Ramlibacter sp.]